MVYSFISENVLYPPREGMLKRTFKFRLISPLPSYWEFSVNKSSYSSRSALFRELGPMSDSSVHVRTADLLRPSPHSHLSLDSVSGVQGVGVGITRTGGGEGVTADTRLPRLLDICTCRPVNTVLTCLTRIFVGTRCLKVKVPEAFGMSFTSLVFRVGWT